MASSSSDSDSSSRSDDSEDRRSKRQKREKKEKRERKKEKKSKDRKKRKDRKREKHSHKHKHRKADKERDGTSAAVATLRETASGASWGRYGVLREGDMYSKQEEFLAWLSEVKGVPQDACGQRELKEYFESFCEDYNTATMPSTKYYNLAKWYAEEQRRRADAGEPLAERSTFNDEAELAREAAILRSRRQEETTALMAKAMREGEGLVADMREQEQMKLKMRQAYATGDTSTARALSGKLDPTKVTAEDIKKKFGSYAPSARGAG